MYTWNEKFDWLILRSKHIDWLLLLFFIEKKTYDSLVQILKVIWMSAVNLEISLKLPFGSQLIHFKQKCLKKLAYIYYN